MREEIITSGRLNPNIDPHLEIWHWHIPLYLFLGGLAAGILFFAALYTVLGKENKYPGAVKRACFVFRFETQNVFLAVIHHYPHSIAHVVGRVDFNGNYSAFHGLGSYPYP